MLIISDYMILVYTFHEYLLFIARSAIMTLGLYVAAFVTNSMDVDDHAVFSTNVAAEDTLHKMQSLLSRLIPADIARCLTHDRGCNTMMPAPVATSLMTNIAPVNYMPSFLVHSHNVFSTHWRKFEYAVVVSMDIVEFTKITKSMMDNAPALFECIRNLYIRIDKLTDETGVWKMYTAGDSYVIASCTGNDNNDVAYKAIHYANRLCDVIKDINSESKPGVPELHIRIGVADGSALTGLVGEYRPAFLLWGSAHSDARDMEKSGSADVVRVHYNMFNKHKSMINKMLGNKAYTSE
jgi:class 3 adenylate cyclase